MTFKVLFLKCIRAKEIMTDLKKRLFVLVDVLCVVVGKRVQCFNVQCHILKFIYKTSATRCCLRAFTTLFISLLGFVFLNNILGYVTGLLTNNTH